MFAFLKRLTSPKERLKHLLGDAELPAFPATTTQVLTALRDPKIDSARLGRLVEADPGLTVRVLRMVNSSAFGLRKPVQTVPHAVSLVGRGTLETLVLTSAVNRTLPRAPHPGFEPQRFWRAAARRAATARAFADMLDPSTAATSFVAGMLQDLAVPLLAHHHPDKRYGDVLTEWHARGGSLGALERSAFGWSHADVGGWVCEAWSFPAQLSELVEGHHDARRAPPAVLLASGIDEARPERSIDVIVAVARDRYGASPDSVVAALERGAERGDELARLLAA